MMRIKRQRERQTGFSLIEVMFAILVLAIGLAGSVVLFMTAISMNGRNKSDTAAAATAQMVLERLAANPAHSTNTVTAVTIQDCNPAGATTWTMNTLAGGATVDGTTGEINWGAQTYAALNANNYAMRYVGCGTGSRQQTFEVRWNVQAPTNFTKLITVGVRPLGQGQGLVFVRPTTLRTIAGM